MTHTSKFIAALLVSGFMGSAVLADPVATPAMAPAPTTAVTGTHTLTVTVTGVRSARGNIRAQLLKADYTAGNAKTVGATIVAATQGTVTLTFTGLSDGDYSVQMFHDEDGDGEMKTNLFGIPSEGFAFSNGARAAFGPPKFKDMKVTVNADTTTVANMAY